MNRRALAASLAVAASILGVPGAARAIERQHHVGLGPELAILKIDDKSTVDVGAGVGVDYAYGLNDQWNLMVEGSSAVVAAGQQQDAPDTPRTRPSDVYQAAVGVGYVIDVIRWVPYIGVLGAGYVLTGGTLEKALFIPGVEIAAGLDYQFSRSWSIGIGVRQNMLLTKLSTYPSYTLGLLRLEFMWGY